MTLQQKNNRNIKPGKYFHQKLKVVTNLLSDWCIKYQQNQKISNYYKYDA
ncbi:unnamed protein product [Paramecium primaurelia]|uniref:Uncharacterized protein n=1 Tax=Paramecium primaurelia TaxID=5886 RepID=A0A8S1NY85_PARPR|nr:unnamed protein product [Paramecium primaurelia]